MTLGLAEFEGLLSAHRAVQAAEAHLRRILEDIGSRHGYPTPGKAEVLDVPERRVRFLPEFLQ